MKNRSKTALFSEILELARDGAQKTKIMYNAFLSYSQLKDYLTVLIENGLIEHQEGGKVYRTTEKGLYFLRMHNQINELISTNNASMKLKL